MSEQQPNEKPQASNKEAAPEQSARVSIEQFAALELRVAQITSVEPHPKADRLYVLQVDLGEEAPRQLVAGIRAHREAEELVGKRIVVVANLEPAKLRGVESQGMLLAAGGRDDTPLALLTVDADVPLGTRVS